MKLYIAGPIAKYKNDLDAARAVFERAAERLQAAGYTTVNPMDVPPGCHGKCDGVKEREGDHHARTCYLRFDLIAMLRCDGVALLSDWQDSEGARKEREVAIYSGIPVDFVNAWIIKREKEKS